MAATATISETQENCRAVSIGSNFQLNIGMARPDGENADGLAAGGPGTMNIIGAVAKAPNSANAANSIMRIGNGWTVNAFSKIENLSTIDIMNGKLVLMAAGKNTAEAASAFRHLKANISHSAFDGTAIKVYQNNGLVTDGENMEYIGQPKNNQYGPVAIKNSAKFPIGGSLLISDGHGLRFHCNAIGHSGEVAEDSVREIDEGGDPADAANIISLEAPGQLVLNGSLDQLSMPALSEANCGIELNIGGAPSEGQTYSIYAISVPIEDWESAKEHLPRKIQTFNVTSNGGLSTGSKFDLRYDNNRQQIYFQGIVDACTTTRWNPLFISCDNEQITFTLDHEINNVPANVYCICKRPFTGDEPAIMRNIDVTHSAASIHPAKGIHFFDDFQENTYPAKVLTLTNKNIEYVNDDVGEGKYLISVSNSAGDATAIDLENFSGSLARGRESTINLENSGSDDRILYKFAAKAFGDGSGDSSDDGICSVVIGAVAPEKYMEGFNLNAAGVDVEMLSEAVAKDAFAGSIAASTVVGINLMGSSSGYGDDQQMPSGWNFTELTRWNLKSSSCGEMALSAAIGSNEIDVDDTSMSAWQINKLRYSTMESSSTGVESAASLIFGTNNIGGDSAYVSDWIFDGISTSELTASTIGGNRSMSNLFGVNHIGGKNAKVDGWAIGSDDSWPISIIMLAKADGPNHSMSNIFGVNEITGNAASLSGWGIESLDDTKLTATATGLNSGTAIFGANIAIGGTFDSWVISDIKATTLKSMANGVCPADGNANEPICAASTVFGCSSGSAKLTEWAIGNFTDNTTLVSMANAYLDRRSDGSLRCVDAYSTVFGYGLSYGESFTDLITGDFAGDTLIASSANASLASGVSNAETGAYATIFGSGLSGNGKSSGWTIGNFENGVVLSSAVASSAGMAYGAVFGTAYTSDNQQQTSDQFSDMSVEFQGGASVTATGYSKGGNLQLSTLGGNENVNLRFYFNDINSRNGVEEDGSYPPDQCPNIYLAALKLTENWKIENSNAIATVGSCTDANTRALALGPLFSLSVGRAREIDSDGKETMASISASGFTSIGSGEGAQHVGCGTLHIIGSVARAPMSSPSNQFNGSTMIIDSGWTVKAYAPIQDFGHIALLNGSMELVASSDDLKNAISEMKLVHADPSSGEIYSGGNVQLNAAHGLKANGRLTVDSYETLAFGVDGDQLDDSIDIEQNSSFKKVKCHLILPAEKGNPRLELKGKWAIDFAKGDGGFQNDNSNFWVIRVKETGSEVAVGDVVSGIGAVAKNPITVDSLQLYPITASSELQPDNVQLYWLSSDKIGSGIVAQAYNELPPSNEEARNPIGNAASGVATMAVSGMAAMQDGIRCRLHDIKGNGDDPFIRIFGTHEHSEGDGSGFNANTYGMLIGLDFVSELKNSALIRYGATIGYYRTDADFSNDLLSSEKHSKQNMFYGGLFAGYESFNSKQLKTNLMLSAGCGFMDNKMLRIDGRGRQFDGSFTGNNRYATCEITKNLLRICGIQFGPWVAVSYNHVHNKGYRELGIAAIAIELSKVDFTFVDATIGLNAEKEFHSQSDPEKRFRLFSKIGYIYRAVASHSSCAARLGHGEAFSPTVIFGTRGAATISGGFRAKINKNVEIIGSIGGEIARNRSYFSASAGCGYSF
jgi:hypothetical protein